MTPIPRGALRAAAIQPPPASQATEAQTPRRRVSAAARRPALDDVTPSSGFREIVPPAGTGQNVRAYSLVANAGRVDATGARVQVIRVR